MALKKGGGGPKKDNGPGVAGNGSAQAQMRLLETTKKNNHGVKKDDRKEKEGIRELRKIGTKKKRERCRVSDKKRSRPGSRREKEKKEANPESTRELMGKCGGKLCLGRRVRKVRRGWPEDNGKNERKMETWRKSGESWKAEK